MNYHNFREYKLLEGAIPIADHLNKDIVTEYLIVWWWIAGLHAAQELLNQWVKWENVVLIEKSICGWWMSGKSWWFLTPDSELGLRALMDRYGEKIARKIWDFGSWGQSSIVENVKSNNFRCDFRNQDSLLLWLGVGGFDACKEEDADRRSYWYDSEFIASKKDLQKYNTGDDYTSWVKYTDCYGICWYQYCQSLKQLLESQWVRVFEFTQVDKIEEESAHTNHWIIRFKYCFLCPGRVSKHLSPSKAKLLFGVMNFITVSEPLTDEQVKGMMPNGDFMCRDTKMVFSYYRIIWWNRVILGWWNPISSFLPWDIQYESTIKETVWEFKKTFPSLKWAIFSEYRSGRIQVSKDLMPIIDACETHCNHTRVLGCAWLPWAAACGQFAVQRHFGKWDTDLEKVFAQDRKWLIDRFPTNSIIKSVLFAISNAWAMFWQKGY
jgi:gamma-glutamylputrescine oxidase